MQVDPEKPVLVAGDPERTHEVKVVSDGGIWYHDNLIDALVSVSSICIILKTSNIPYSQNKLAEKLEVAPIKVKS